MAKVYLETIEIEALERATTNLRDRLLIRVLTRLGCRISEALGLEVKDLDFNERMVTIKHLKSRIKLSCSKCGTQLGKSHTYCPKCGARVEEAIAKEQEHRRIRRLPLDNNTLEMLRDFIKRGGPVTRKGNELLFGVNRHRGWQIIKECAEKAGLPKLVNTETGRVHNVSPHRLRDAFAIRAVKLDDTGDGLRMLQEHLGHTNFDTTAKYRKVAGEELKDWYQKLWASEKNDDGHTT